MEDGGGPTVRNCDIVPEPLRDGGAQTQNGIPSRLKNVPQLPNTTHFLKEKESFGKGENGGLEFW